MLGSPIPLRRRLLGSLMLLCYSSSLIVSAVPPEWWSQVGVDGYAAIDPAATDPNPKGLANIGQAKFMAKRALEALRAIAPGTATHIETDLVGSGKIIPSWDVPAAGSTAAQAQRSPLLVGQLKAIAAPFYQHLHALDAEWLGTQLEANQTKDAADSTNYYPWTSATTDDSNRAIATIGQLKAVFALGFESLDPNRDGDGDGLTNAEEIAFSSNPNNPDSDGDGLTDAQEKFFGTNPQAVDSQGKENGTIQNGDFTQIGSGPGSSHEAGWDYWNGIPGWKAVNGTNIELQTIWPKPDGSGQYCELKAHPTGNSGITQQVPTEPGKTYILTFDCKARPDVDPNQSVITVRIDNDIANLKTITPTGDWTTRFVIFTAANYGTDIALLPANDPGNTVGCLVDNVSLVPMDFVNPRGIIHELQVSDCAPRVELDALSTSNVTVSGDQASVRISGHVFDPITALLPPGAADLSSLRVYVNGTKLAACGTLQRQSADQGMWKPYGDKFDIAPFDISFPACGTNLIRIETQPNAAGIIGKAEFEVAFRTEFTPRPPVPAFTIECDVILGGTLDPAVKDTVRLAAVGEASGITLTETDNDTGVFVSTQGHAFVMHKTFSPTAGVDRLPCSLMLPDSPMSTSSKGQAGQCLETGPQTLRFRYTEVIPGYPQDSIRSEVLDSVYMRPLVARENDGWFPIAFKMGAEIEGWKLRWFGKDFPIKSTDHGIFAITKDANPLVGIIVKRQQEPADPEAAPPPPVLEFMYYDHTANSIVRVPLDESLGKHPWSLMRGDDAMHTSELLLKQIAFVNADGSPAEGIIPLPIETLQSILEGGTPEISLEQYAFIELRGHIDGEVVRFRNEEAPFDYYDLIAGDGETLLQEGPCHVRLQKIGERKFRTTQKAVIYSANEASQQVLTQEQWLALRNLGYLAIHNDKKKVFEGKEDIEWLEKERGSFHPPSGTKMGIPGESNPFKADFYRFEGFDDHHLFNKFHGEDGTGKALVWSKLFEGEGFDVDEFTVPVRKGVHSKVQHLADKGWRSFVNEVFDATTGELRPHIKGKVLARKRAEAFALMEELVEEMGLELKWVRPYPQLLNPAYAKSPSLARRLINSRGRLGESLDRLGSLSSKFLKVLGAEAEEVGQKLFKKHVKSFLKSGGKGVAKCLPLLAFTSHADALEMLTYTSAGLPKEGAAHWLNNTLALEDLPLAREVVNNNWKLFEDQLDGADGKPCAKLPSGAVIKVGDPSFTCAFDSSGKIVHITPYVVINIWVFPDGRVKTRRKMTEEPYYTSEEDDEEWHILDWYPAIGETKSDYLEALQRAGAFNDYGDP